MQEIDAATFLQHPDQWFLIDVREDFEHEHLNIGGINTPLSDLFHYTSQIPQNQPVLVYCKKGIRSQIAIQRLQEKLGINNLVNLKGGIEAILALKK